MVRSYTDALNQCAMSARLLLTASIAGEETIDSKAQTEVSLRRPLAHHRDACRIVYAVDEKGPIKRYGFANGTLPEHAESGEERFTVEWHEKDDAVWYDILAFSRPRHFLARLGYPLARRLQERFARDSVAAMMRAVKHESTGRKGIP